MVLGLPLGQFFAIWLLVIFVTTIISLLPFAIQRFYPQAYRGLWKTAGELLRSPARALTYPLGSLIGLLLIIVFLHRRDITVDEAQTLLLLGLGLFITFLAIPIGIRLYLLEKNNNTPP